MRKGQKQNTSTQGAASAATLWFDGGHGKDPAQTLAHEPAPESAPTLAPTGAESGTQTAHTPEREPCPHPEGVWCACTKYARRAE